MNIRKIFKIKGVKLVGSNKKDNLTDVVAQAGNVTESSNVPEGQIVTGDGRIVTLDRGENETKPNNKVIIKAKYKD